MKTLLCNIIVLTIMINLTEAQNIPSQINRTDDLNQPTGKWEYYYDDSGELRETGNYEDGRKVGLWKSFYPSGALKHEITYQEDVAKGPAKFYYRDGTLWEEGYWDENHWKGEYNLYHANGKKFYQWNYNNAGKRMGEQKYFHANGQLQYSGNWNNGGINGEIKVFDDTGALIEKREYTDGSFSKNTIITDRPTNQDTDSDSKILPFYGTGHYTLLEKDGKMVKEGYFRDGKLQDGKHFIYNENDSLIEVKIMENGKYKAF